MAARLQLSCGLRGSCKSARQGLGFPASEVSGRTRRTPRPFLPPEIVRLIDAIMRAAERVELLRAMNGGDLGKTLRDAALAGGLLDVRFLLAAGADAGARNGWALYAACNGGHLQVAEALLDAGGTLTPRHRNHALHFAALYGRTACCALMLDRGADINSRPYGLDALCSAAQHGHLETVALLLDRGADAWSERALAYATENQHDAVVALLLARHGGGAAHIDSMAVRLQLSCGLRGSCKSARQGLGFPASEPDAIGTPRPYLPPELVLLIDAMLRVTERAEMLRAMTGGDLGMTLRDAARAGGLLNVRLLLVAGVDAGAVYGDALYVACTGGHLQVAEALLDAGGTLTPCHRNCALRCAADHGCTACCELMLDNGADIHRRGPMGDALCQAARSGHPETVAFLLDRGANAWSARAMQLAIDGHHHAVVALLLARRGGGATQ